MLVYWLRWRLAGRIRMTHPEGHVTFVTESWRRARYLVRHYRKMGFR